MRTRIIVITIISLLTLFVANKAKNSIANITTTYNENQQKVINDLLR